MNIHFPIDDIDFLSENPKLRHRRIASGSIPFPSSSLNKQAHVTTFYDIHE